MKPFAQIMSRQDRAVYALSGLYHQYGYTQYTMSRFEEYELYLRNKDFLVSDSIVTFTDPAGRLMALKPDVTLSIVKNLREFPGGVQRVYYNENVYRVPKGSQSVKEIMQVGLECMGSVDEYCMYEVLSLAVQSLAVLDQPFVFGVSDLSIVKAIIDGCGLVGGDAEAAMHWVSEKNAHELKNLCAQYGLNEEKSRGLLNLVKTYGALKNAIGEVEKDLTGLVDASVLNPFLNLLRDLSDDTYADSIWVDFSVMNDIRYYNGLVFQGFVKGIPDGILSGGQYDGLMEKMGKSSRALGFAVYLDLLDRLDSSDRGYDVDTLIVYDDSSEPYKVRSAVQSFVDMGLTVLAVRQEPENIRYKNRIYIHNGKTEVSDHHA